MIRDQHSTTAQSPIPIRVALVITHVALGLASVALLVSFGGQVLLGPWILPLQWLAARFTRLRSFYVAVATLLMFEIGWLTGYEASSSASIATAIAVTAAVIAGFLFVRTTSHSPEDNAS